MPNRYCRDELIKHALNMSQSGNLIEHDMPNGVVSFDAFSIQWVQDILDFWYHMVPFSSSVVADFAITIPANTSTVNLPLDFILDMRNGLLVPTITGDPLSLGRVIRVSMPKIVSFELAYQKTLSDFPYVYTIMYNKIEKCQTLRISPKTKATISAKLWYYALPDVLDSDDTPAFPSDYVILEYLRIRAMEWSHALDPGMAQKFCERIIGGMRAAGLMNEPEDDQIHVNPLSMPQIDYRSVYAWLGPQ